MALGPCFKTVENLDNPPPKEKKGKTENGTIYYHCTVLKEFFLRVISTLKHNLRTNFLISMSVT